MSDPKALAQRAIKAIDERRDALFALSRAIHAKPELAYEEREAAIRITEFLEGAGFAVERGYKNVETSYRGDAKGRGPGPTVAILQEYDALAEIGHACGHNLIAMIGVAASVGVRAVMDQLPGKLAAIGTPAEEGGGGKVALIRAGGFDDVDVAMMIHPTSGRSLAGRHSLASNRVMVEFRGKSAHAASQPDLGINALELLPPADSFVDREWGYATSNYFAADFDLGFPRGHVSPTASSDLASLVTACHRHRLRFFADVVMAFATRYTYRYSNFLDFHVHRGTGDPEEDARDDFGGDLFKYNFLTDAYDPIAGGTARLVPARRLMLTCLARWMLDFRVDGVAFHARQNTARSVGPL